MGRHLRYFDFTVVEGRFKEDIGFIITAFSNPSNTNPSSLSFLCLVVCGQYQLIKKSGMDSLMARKTIAVVLKQIKSHFDLNSTDEKFYEYLMDKFKVSNK
jgi:hypothetical protein